MLRRLVGGGPDSAARECRLPRVILSDRTIREEIAAGGIVIEPLDEADIQPSSVDVHVDRYFRVFRNDTTPYIDPKQPQEDLTELVEVEDGGAFILHPGEFVLGSTLERVELGSDLVGRLEGKSSLGRLGLLIHSSLPASERVMVEIEGRLEPRSISEIVESRLEASVVAFDPETFDVAYHPITGWYEGPPDRIYEVRLASGRKLRVTAGHNLFTLDGDGNVAKTRTLALGKGSLVAIPRSIPDCWDAAETIEVLELAPDEARGGMTCSGPTVAAAFERDPGGIKALLKARSIKHFGYWRGRSRLPIPVAAEIEGLLEGLTPLDRVAVRGARHGLPPWLELDADLAWLVGMYVAEGYRRPKQVVISNTDQAILDRVERILEGLGISTYRSEGHSVTACSALLSLLMDWLGTGGRAHSKRIPPAVFGWPRERIEDFLEGMVDGDGSRDETRVSVWTCSDGLAADVLLLAERLGYRAGSTLRKRPDGGQLWQVYFPRNEHKLLTAVPVPDRLLVEMRERAGLTQTAASRLAGYRNRSDLGNIENASRRDAVRLATLRKVRTAYARRPECSEQVRRLDRLIAGGLLWDRVVDVRDTGSVEAIYDLEVKPDGRRIENFLAGEGGVFASNTAGFVDAGWEGHLTLELSNVANLPIAIYPGMKIGQLSFVRMTSEAEHPYGGKATDSKYKGQTGPTASRYYLNFRDDD
jgi:deoxycytidine triphosphate deaminase